MLGGNARSCAIFMFTQLAFDQIAGSDADIRERVNEHAGFWNGVLGGLQTAAFVALGRIFDTRKDTNNAGRLLLYAVDHPGIFSEASLAARKVAQGLNPTFAAQYASEAHHLKKGDLQPLVDALDQQRAYYDDAVAPIRHNVFAHQGRMTRAERDEIFAQLPIRQLEALVVFPLRLYDALWALYMNGAPPELRSAPTNVAEITAAGLGKNVSTWEHLHVVANVAALLKALRLEPPAE
ncbi:MAG: hypothetical protein WCE38_09910 [Burkholderiales bacterium]